MYALEIWEGVPYCDSYDYTILSRAALQDVAQRFS